MHTHTQLYHQVLQETVSPKLNPCIRYNLTKVVIFSELD